MSDDNIYPINKPNETVQQILDELNGVKPTGIIVAYMDHDGNAAVSNSDMDGFEAAFLLAALNHRINLNLFGGL